MRQRKWLMIYGMRYPSRFCNGKDYRLQHQEERIAVLESNEVAEIQGDTTNYNLR